LSARRKPVAHPVIVDDEKVALVQPVGHTTGALSQATVKPSSIREILLAEIGEEGRRQHAYFYVTRDQYLLSPWHDIPARPLERGHLPETEQTIVHMVSTMPKHTSERFEVKLQYPHTPLGPEFAPAKSPLHLPNPRYSKWDNFPVNEGVLPQTWCDPEELALDTKWAGSDTPLAIVEIGQSAMERGKIASVKILGVLGVLERPILYWKVIAIRLDAPNAALVDDISDVETHFPGLLDEIREFYRCWPTAENRPVAQMVFSGEYRDREFALEVIKQAHDCWRLAYEEDFAIGTKNPDIHFKWQSRTAENVADDGGGIQNGAISGAAHLASSSSASSDPI